MYVRCTHIRVCDVFGSVLAREKQTNNSVKIKHLIKYRMMYIKID